MDGVLDDVKELRFVLFCVLFICVVMTPWLLFFQPSVFEVHTDLIIMAGFALKYSRNRKVRGRGGKTGNQWYLRVHSILLSAWTFANEINKRLKTPSSSAGCIINVPLLTMGISRMKRFTTQSTDLTAVSCAHVGNMAFLRPHPRPSETD